MSAKVPRPDLVTLARRRLREALLVPLNAKHELASRGFPPTANERRLVALRDKHRGGRCVIIGGGPSLKRTDLSLLRNELTFAVNGFYHLFDELGFLPSYYVVEDRLVAEDNAAALNRLSGMTRIYPEDLRYRLRASNETVFLRFDRFYSDPDRPAADFPRFVDPARLRFFWGGTVTYLNLQLAYYMGFTDVLLIGMDMTYGAPPGGITHVMTSSGDDPNHVHPAWFGAGKRWHDPQVERMQRAFLRARDVYAAAGRRLRNATVGGRLAGLERVALEDALRG